MSVSLGGPAWGDAAFSQHSLQAPSAVPLKAVAEREFEGRVEEFEPDASGVRVTIEYRKNPETGAKEKVIRRIRREVRTYAIPACVTERRSWKRFGRAAEGNEGCTTTSYDELHFEKPSKTGAVVDEDPLLKLVDQKSLIVCRHCNAVGDHYTLKCPLREFDMSKGKAVTPAMDRPSGPPGTYVPPARRDGAAASMVDAEVPFEEQRRLRISNLAEDVDEDEIRALLVPFGKIERMSLKTKEMGNSTAFVTYSMHSEALKAMAALDGYGFHYLILRIEWAKQNNNRDFGGSSGLSGNAFVSGYGKALPQSRPAAAGPGAK